MIRIENECVGCPDDMGCIFEACPYYQVIRYYCDKCKEEQEELYYFGADELCINCIIEQLERVECND